MIFWSDSAGLSLSVIMIQCAGSRHCLVSCHHLTCTPPPPRPHSCFFCCRTQPSEGVFSLTHPCIKILQHVNSSCFSLAVPVVPPAPSNVSATHPLLIRQTDPQALTGMARVHRGTRRGYRFNPSTHTLHVNLPGRVPQTPVILQR